MEYFDILNENGEKTGLVKERTAVHRDGDLHGTSHIWITRRTSEGKIQVLLQKRSGNKDSYPLCFDTSSAGHIPSGSSFNETAVREVGEELGLEISPEELTLMFMIKTHKEAVFYGEPFIDNQISAVYILRREVDISDIKVQKSEIEYVEWQDYELVKEKIFKRDKKYCVNREEFLKLGEFLAKLYR